MKKSPSQELLDELGAMKADLYVSLYMPTHRVHPENLQDPLRFKELVKKIDQGLQSTFSADQRQELLKPFLICKRIMIFGNI